MAQLELLSEELRHDVPGLFEGLDQVPNRFSCSVSNSKFWSDHCAQMHAIINVTDRVLQHAKDLQISVWFDTAVDFTDYAETWCSMLVEGELMKRLSERGIELMFTVYAPMTEQADTASSG